MQPRQVTINGWSYEWVDTVVVYGDIFAVVIDPDNGYVKLKGISELVVR